MPVTVAERAFASFDAPRERLLIGHGTVRAELWPQLGGSVARLQVRAAGGWHDVLRPTPGGHERYSPKDLGCWPMLPYCGRLRDGGLTFAGTVHRLPPTLPGEALPLHGVGWIRPWHVAHADGQGATLELAEPAGRDWPWAFEARQQFRLLGQGLEVLLELRNASPGPAPCGLGWHPYLHRPPGSTLRAQVEAAWECDGAVLPTVRRSPPPPAWRLGEGCDLDATNLDNCFEGFGGEAWLLRPDGLQVQVTADASARCLVVFNPGDGPYTCVEPATHVPGAPPGLAAPGLVTLAPGAVARLRCTLSLHGRGATG